MTFKEIDGLNAEAASGLYDSIFFIMTEQLIPIPHIGEVIKYLFLHFLP